MAIEMAETPPIWRRKERKELRRKAVSDLTITPSLQAMLQGGPVQFSPDGQLSFFQLFGQSYSKLYKSQSSLRAVVDFLSRNIAECKINLFHRDAEGVALREDDHPVQQLLDHPQKGVPRSRFMRQIVADRAIYDVSAVWKIRENFDAVPPAGSKVPTNKGRVVSLVRLPIPLISVFQGSLSSPIIFRLIMGQTQLEIPAEDIIWMPGYSPDSNTSGVPPVESLRQILAEEWAAGKSQENYWKRGAHMSVVFLQQPDSHGLNDEQADRFKASWQGRYGGVDASHAGETPLLPPGITPKEIAIDAAAAQYMATRKLAREECALAYGIQPQLLGITPANFASMDMFHQMLYQDTLAPWMVPIQEEFEEQLLREFEPVDSGHFLDFNINAKMAGSFIDQAQIGQQATGGPWMTRNEFREKFQQLPPIEGGDEIVIPLNVVIGGGPQANPQDSGTQNQATIAARMDGQGRLHLLPKEE